MKNVTNPPQQSTQKAVLLGVGMGCVVPTLILSAAVVLGFWLDEVLANSKHLYTIGLIVVSVPLTAVALIWGTRVIARHQKTPQQQTGTQTEFLQEDADSDAD